MGTNVFPLHLEHTLELVRRNRIKWLKTVKFHPFVEVFTLKQIKFIFDLFSNCCCIFCNINVFVQLEFDDFRQFLVNQLNLIFNKKFVCVCQQKKSVIKQHCNITQNVANQAHLVSLSVQNQQCSCSAKPMTKCVSLYHCSTTAFTILHEPE